MVNVVMFCWYLTLGDIVFENSTGMSRSIPPAVYQYTTPCSVVYCVTSVCVFALHLFWAPVYTFRYKWVHYYIFVYLLFIIVFGAFVGVLYLSLYMLVDRKEFFQLLSFYTK